MSLKVIWKFKKSPPWLVCSTDLVTIPGCDTTPTLRSPLRYVTLTQLLILYCSTLINSRVWNESSDRAILTNPYRHASKSRSCPFCVSYVPVTIRCHLSNISKQKMRPLLPQRGKLIRVSTGCLLFCACVVCIHNTSELKPVVLYRCLYWDLRWGRGLRKNGSSKPLLP